jgi:cytochrome P450
LFLLAGFETTASALSYCMFMLTQHPKEMRKLQQEIDASFSPNPAELIQPDFDSIQNLEYLDMFVKEVLRFYPIANGAVNRRCIFPTQIKGIDFSTDSVIAVDVLSLHNDPEYWDNPEEFNPLRFAPDNKINPLVYIPFGIGPRICIGMRFALVEIKLILAKILSKYDVLPSVHTTREILFAEGVVRRPRDGIPVMIKKRVN